MPAPPVDPPATVCRVKWGGSTSPAWRRWLLAGALLELAGLTMHVVGGRPWDVPWVLLTIIAGGVVVVGVHRYQAPR